MGGGCNVTSGKKACGVTAGKKWKWHCDDMGDSPVFAPQKCGLAIRFLLEVRV